MNFAFRIHESYNNVDISKLIDDCEQVAIYQHDADDEVARTHIHGVCINYKYKYDTAVKHFKGKYEYAMTMKIKGTDKVPDTTFMAYMSKGKYDPVFTKGISADEIALAKSLGFDKKDKVIENKKLKGTYTDRMLKEKGLTHWDIVEYVRSKALKTEVLRNTDIGVVACAAYADYGQIYDLLVEKLEECKIKTHQSDLERWFCTIVRNDASSKAVVRENILKKYSKD